MSYFVQVVNDGTPGALYEAGDDYQLATLLLAKVLVKNGIAITPEVVECIDDSGYYDDGQGKGVYVVQSETYSEEADEDLEQFEFDSRPGQGVLYGEGRVILGEFDGDDFVPSRALLEKDAEYQRKADNFAHNENGCIWRDERWVGPEEQAEEDRRDHKRGLYGDGN